MIAAFACPVIQFCLAAGLTAFVGALREIQCFDDPNIVPSHNVGNTLYQGEGIENPSRGCRQEYIQTWTMPVRPCYGIPEC